MNNPEQTAYLIDSSIYIFRAWQTLPASVVDASGEQANAVHGFADFLTNLLEQTQAKYIVCAFDKRSGTSTRALIYPDYKANRSPAPPALKRQFLLCEQLAQAMGIAQYSDGKLEADDIIGTLSNTAREHQLTVSIVSADKDLMQFIRGGDEYWNFARKIRLDYRTISKRFGAAPEQIADLLALSGDKVDNIPGIPGVGTATAAKLLSKWGTLDNLFENAAAVAQMKFRGAPHISALLGEYEATVRVNRQLTGLLPVDHLPTTLNVFERKPVDSSVLPALMHSLKFSQEQQDRLTSVLETTSVNHTV